MKNLKMGENVQVKYIDGKKTGIVGEIIYINFINDDTVYGIKTSSGKRIAIPERYVFKMMKIKYKMVVIPFEFVPHRVIFRFKNAWWRRLVGSESQAEQFVEDADTPCQMLIDQRELVITNKGELEKKLAHAHIVDEFDL